MADWLVVMSEDNWEVCAREGLVSVGRHANTKLGRLAEGDRLWIYVNRAFVHQQTPRVRRIRAVASVNGPIRTLEKSPWQARGWQEFTSARPIRVDMNVDIEVEVLKHLSFAANRRNWGWALISAPIQLTSDDVGKLEAAARP